MVVQVINEWQGGIDLTALFLGDQPLALGAVYCVRSGRSQQSMLGKENRKKQTAGHIDILHHDGMVPRKKGASA